MNFLFIQSGIGREDPVNTDSGVVSVIGIVLSFECGFGEFGGSDFPQTTCISLFRKSIFSWKVEKPTVFSLGPRDVREALEVLSLRDKAISSIGGGDSLKEQKIPLYFLPSKSRSNSSRNN